MHAATFAHWPALLVIIALLILGGTPLQADPIHLESTFFYDGDFGLHDWTPTRVAVAPNGTVAVSINRTIGPDNSSMTNGSGSMIILYDKNGNPFDTLHGQTSGFNDLTFGPDLRIYTAEGWFGSGLHVYDTPFDTSRLVPVRFLRSDGSNVDHGGAQTVACAPNYDLWDYNARDSMVHVVSPDDHNLATIAPPAGLNSYRIKISPDGVVYMSNYMLAPDNKTWIKLDYTVLDIRSDGKFLIQTPDGNLARLDRKTGTIEAHYPMPPDAWGDFALGPDDNVYMTPQTGRDDGHDAGLAYVVLSPAGKILMRRGADFDRLSVDLPSDSLTAGAPTTITALTERSRDMGYVPAVNILPDDNHAALELKAWVAPEKSDPFAPLVWTPVPMTPEPVRELLANGESPYQITPPANLFGRYILRFTAGRVVPAYDPLNVTQVVTIRPAGATAFAQPSTDRDRIGFVCGKPIRFAVHVTAMANVDLSSARLALQGPAGVTAWQAPLGLGQMATGSETTPVVEASAYTTENLAPGMYHAVVAGLPAGAGSGSALIQLVSPVPATDFETVMHPIGGASATALDARFHASLGTDHVVITSQMYPGSAPEYLDAATRLGITVQYQPYGHFAAINTLPNEQGFMRHYFAVTAQADAAYPSFDGFNYHDLWSPFGTWWDGPRADSEKALWKQLGDAIGAPPTVPADDRDAFIQAEGRAQQLPAAYKEWADAIRYAAPGLIRSTMQWWHLDWTYANPDLVAADQDVIATQHMEEQYYHPATIADQAEDWRIDGKPLWVYGNTDWQEDGTGGQAFRDIMTAFSRGVQGAGRNEVPANGIFLSEMGSRGPSPALKLMRVYGGIAAHSVPENQVAVWRSVYAMDLENGKNRRIPEQHFWNTSAAFNSCLYARRNASIITDDKVRSGQLMRYKAVIISFEHPLPDDLLKPLHDFQRAGGIVIANKPLDGYWRPDGAIEVGSAFTDSHSAPDKNDDLARWLDMQAVEGTTGAKAVRDALDGRITPLVDTDNAATWLTVLKSGLAHYVVAVNMNLVPQPWQDLHRYAGYENTTFPVKPVLTISSQLAGASPVIYDVFHGTRVTPTRTATGDYQVTADMSVFPGAVFAILPHAITSVRLGGGQSANGREIRVVARPFDSAGAAVDAAVPMRIRLTDGVGVLRYDLDRTASGGLWSDTLPVCGAPGKWTLTAQELLGGNTATASLQVVRPNDYELRQVEPAGFEFTNPDRISNALTGHQIAIVVDGKQTQALSSAIGAAQSVFQGHGFAVSQVSADDYLADVKALHWDGYNPGDTYRPDMALHTKKYDLIVVLDTARNPSPVIDRKTLPVEPTATDPGPGRALVQFVAMPVYDNEDAIVITGGDAAAISAAAKMIFDFRDFNANEFTNSATDVKRLETGNTTGELPGMTGIVGIPISQVATSPDGSRIAVTMKGWGNKFFVLDANGKVLHSDEAGKFFPNSLTADAGGFWINTYENDPTTAYRKRYDLDGNPLFRLAADGRRMGGARDFSASHPLVQDRFEPQSSFSASADDTLAAVGGSRGIAVWDLPDKKVIWRDDTVFETVPITQNADVAPAASEFPQVSLSPDGKSLVLQYNSTIYFRAGATGEQIAQQQLPQGVPLGRVRVWDGHVLVVGDNDFYAFRDQKPIWHWKAPADITSMAFSPDGEHYVIGQPDGELRIMDGGGQVGGFESDMGGIDSVAISADGTRIAYATGGGQAGLLDDTGQVLAILSLAPSEAEGVKILPPAPSEAEGELVSGVPERVAFLGSSHSVIVGDWTGRLSRYDAQGKRAWTVDLTPGVWRDDLTTVLTTPDPTDTLRVPPPPGRDTDAVPPGTLLVQPQGISYDHTIGWHGGNDPAVGVIQGLLRGASAPPLTAPWFDRDTVYWIAGAPSAPAVEITLSQPTPVDAVVVYEDPAHPESIPSEIKIEAWVNGNWQVVSHDLWVNAPVHVEKFAPVTTTKLKYTILGDLYRNVWTRGIEVYRAP